MPRLRCVELHGGAESRKREGECSDSLSRKNRKGISHYSIGFGRRNTLFHRNRRIEPGLRRRRGQGLAGIGRWCAGYWKIDSDAADLPYVRAVVEGSLCLRRRVYSSTENARQSAACGYGKFAGTVRNTAWRYSQLCRTGKA